MIFAHSRRELSKAVHEPHRYACRSRTVLKPVACEHLILGYKFLKKRPLTCAERCVLNRRDERTSAACQVYPLDKMSRSTDHAQSGMDKCHYSSRLVLWSSWGACWFHGADQSPDSYIFFCLPSTTSMLHTTSNHL